MPLEEDPGAARTPSRGRKDDVFLALLALTCAFGLANLWLFARPLKYSGSTGYRPGLFPPSALAVPPGDDEEFADLTLSDLLLGLAEIAGGGDRDTPRLTAGQIDTLRSLLPEMREQLATPAGSTDRGAALALKRTLFRGHLLYFQKVRKRNLGRAREDSANLSTVEAYVTSPQATPR